MPDVKAVFGVTHQKKHLFQPKLTVNVPGDSYEQEADAMAERAMRMPATQNQAKPATGLIGKSVQRKCQHCEEEEEKKLMRKEDGSGLGMQASPSLVSSINASRGGGMPLAGATRSFMENAFSTDFSRVRVHTDGKASDMTESINAKAFTHGSDIYFRDGRFNDQSVEGKKLLAHELTHVVQQADSISIQRDADNSPVLSPGPRGNPEVHFPFVDELLTQVSDVHSELAGRGLFPDEIEMARSIFGNSVDYSKVRIIPTGLADRTTAGNNIRVPKDYFVKKRKGEDTNPAGIAQLSFVETNNRELLIHEMTHVWQFQHNGAGYITTSLLQQADAGVKHGKAKYARNFAYDYHINSGNSFFEFAPEQQAFIVEHYFKMLNDQQVISSGEGANRSYYSNHLTSDGSPVILNAAQRTAEINAELELHAKLVAQMNSTPFISREDLLRVRQKSVVITGPDDKYSPPGSGPQFTPTPNLFEVRF